MGKRSGLCFNVQFVAGKQEEEVGWVDRSTESKAELGFPHPFYCPTRMRICINLLNFNLKTFFI